MQTYEGPRALTFWQGQGAHARLRPGRGRRDELPLPDGRQRRRAATACRPTCTTSRSRRTASPTSPRSTRSAATSRRVEGGSQRRRSSTPPIQEIDMKTGLVRWEWHSLDHVAAERVRSRRRRRAPRPWDYFHLNSIDPEPGGDLLISARSTWAAYQLQAGSGDDPLAPRRPEELVQDGARAPRPRGSTTLACSPSGDVTLFDDGSNPPVHPQSRAVRIALDFKTHEARLRSRVHAPQPAAARREPGQRADAGEREHGRRLRRRPGDHRVRAGTARCSSTPTCPTTCPSTAASLPLERAPAEPAGGRREPQQHRRRDDRAHELERRHRRRPLAGARGQSGRQLLHRGRRSRRATSRARRSCRRTTPTSQVQALDSAGRVLGRSPTGRGRRLRGARLTATRELEAGAPPSTVAPRAGAAPQ